MKVCLFSLPIICLGMGCAASYNIGVNGYSSNGQTLQIPDASSIAVVTDSNAPNPILEKELGMKIEKLLIQRGYNIGTDKADYYLLFDYGIDSGRTVTDFIPIYHPSAYSEYRFWRVHMNGYTTYVPYSAVIYTRWLTLRLIDSKAYGISQKAEPLWIGEVASARASPDLREIINYMLVAAFEHFGEDTGRQVTEFISRRDERVGLLMER